MILDGRRLETSSASEGFGVEQRQVDGIEAYNFPDDMLGHPQLAWMGDDYVRFVATELLRRFQQQDAGTELVAIKCEPCC